MPQVQIVEDEVVAVLLTEEVVDAVEATEGVDEVRTERLSVADFTPICSLMCIEPFLVRNRSPSWSWRRSAMMRAISNKNVLF